MPDKQVPAIMKTNEVKKDEQGPAPWIPRMQPLSPWKPSHRLIFRIYDMSAQSNEVIPC